jgi:flagellar biosynthesis chaperone FliJ
LGQLSTVLKGAEQEVAIGERRVERAQKLAAEAKLAWDKVEQLEQRQSARLYRAAREKEQKGLDQLALGRYHQRQT